MVNDEEHRRPSALRRSQVISQSPCYVFIIANILSTSNESFNRMKEETVYYFLHKYTYVKNSKGFILRAKTASNKILASVCVQPTHSTYLTPLFIFL